MSRTIRDDAHDVDVEARGDRVHLMVDGHWFNLSFDTAARVGEALREAAIAARETDTKQRAAYAAARKGA